MSVAKINIDKFTCMVGLDVRNPADEGLNYSYRRLKLELTGGLK